MNRYSQGKFSIHSPVFRGLALFPFLAVLLSGCAGLRQPEFATPIPAELLPTVIALTSEAGQATDLASELASGTGEQPEQTPGATETSTPSAAPTRPPATPTPEPSTTSPPTIPPATPVTQEAGQALTPTLAADTPGQAAAISDPASLAPASPFIPAEIPSNPIELRNLGALSKVSSPIHVYAYLKTGAGSRARIELLGEDRRLLYGETKVFNVPEGGMAILSQDIEFEIPAPAEAGRLQISIQDEYGRTTALNSVPLILLSLGDPDITAPPDVLDPFFIHQPTPKALIQGGVVLVSGLARISPDANLLVRLLAEDGRELGMRLASVSLPPEGGYGSFAVEVPYTIQEPAAALLVISIGERDNMDIIHLTSREVLLSP